MNYVEWVEKVALAFARMSKDRGQATLRALQAEIGVDPPPGEDERYVEGAVWTAIEDLDAIPVVNALSHLQILETENTRKLRAGAALATVWPSFFQTFLEPEQSEFLSALVRVAGDQHEHVADVRWATATEVFETLGWPTIERADHSRALSIVNILAEARLVKTRITMGSIDSVRCRPTYKGVVLATQQVATEWQQRLAEMADEWETTTVEHKREVKLSSAAQKGEFVKDILGLATTKASGRERYLLIGYDNDSRTFVQTVPASMTQDRIEQVLHQYTEPMPEIRYFSVPMGDNGEAGVIEVRRDATKVPYQVRRDIGRLKAGDMFVRHGSQTEPPTERELEALMAEGERARSSE